MKDEILTSIVLPFFNGKEFIKETLESLQRQSFRDFEVVAVDDGSTNKEHSEYLITLIDSLADPRFRYCPKLNGGLSDARNYGVGLSKGEWIAFIDQDDLWDEDKLELQMAAVRNNPQINLVFTDGRNIGDLTREMGVASKNGLTEGIISDSYTKLLKGNFVICSSMLFRKSIVEKAGHSNPCFKIIPDFDYIIRLAEHTDFYFLQKTLVSYRIHGSNTVKNQLKHAAEGILLLCDRKLVTNTQKARATYNLLRNILTLCVNWFKKLSSE